MEAKRFREDPDDSDKPENKKLRSLPSFTMVIKQAVAADSLQKIWLAVLEPCLRKVVREEVELVLVRRACLFERSHQMQIEGAQPSSGLQFIFKKPPSLPIFTENKIKDEHGFPLEILLIETATGEKPATPFSSSIKVELVVLHGDFPCDNSESWSSSDFNQKIVKEREGKKPLLTGDTVVTLKDGSAVIDELKFTDNSSWVPSGKFRIGVRVFSKNQHGLEIREAATNRFKVRDHRGEGYKKSYPPALGDDVRRIEKIGKVLYDKLKAENIITVQDFLKLSVIAPDRLRDILRMSEKNWKATIKHARTCPLGDKLYKYKGFPYTIVLSPICEIVNIEDAWRSYSLQELSTSERATLQELILKAYCCWDTLEEISLPSHGEPVNQVLIEYPYQIGGGFEVGLIRNDVQIGLDYCPPPMQNPFS